MKSYFSFKEAKEFCKSHNIKTNIEYRQRYKEATGMLPSLPTTTYKENWEGWRDFLSTTKNHPGYFELKEAIIGKVNTSSEYFVYARLNNLPLSPNLIYSEWKGWGAFLNTKKKFLDFEEAIEVVKDAEEITGVKSYQKHYKRYKGLPSMPQDIYKEHGWVDWYTFLSKDRRADVFISYDEAKLIVNFENVTSSSDYKRTYKDLSLNLPSDPSVSYADCGWVNWKSFLNK